MTSKPRILFVDDEPLFLNGIRRMLHRYRQEWNLEFAESVNSALERISSNDFDLMVTDVNMPGKSGMDLLEILCGEDPQEAPFPIVVLTGNSDGALKRRALELGATDLLNKPVALQDLVARVKSSLRLKAYQDEIRTHNKHLEQKVAERTRDLEISRLDILWRLAKAGEYRDEETGNHTIRVGLFCRTMAEVLGQPADFQERIFLTSPLHDIGKIGIPDGILLKKGRLTPDECKIMRTHCAIGSSILKGDAKGTQYYLQMKFGLHHTMVPVRDPPNPLLETAATIALSHHEHWDGSGYPQGLKGEEIPLMARIVALVDVFDALKSARPYKPAFSDEKTRKIILKEKGRHFDPELVQVFEDSFKTFQAIGQELQDEGDHVPMGSTSLGNDSE